MNGNVEELLNLIEKRDDTEGSKIISKLKRLGRSVYVVNKNYNELREHIEEYEGDLSIWDVKNRSKLQDTLKEFIRLFHNYTASVLSLRDHTYALKDSLDNEELNREYKEQIGNFKKLASFFMDLRQYIQHRRLPLVNATLDITVPKTDEEKGYAIHWLTLNKQELMDWGRLSSDSKDYLKKGNEEIDLKSSLEDYHNSLHDFYIWFFHKVGELYSTEIEECLGIDQEVYERKLDLDK